MDKDITFSSIPLPLLALVEAAILRFICDRAEEQRNGFNGLSGTVFVAVIPKSSSPTPKAHSPNPSTQCLHPAQP